MHKLNSRNRRAGKKIVEIPVIAHAPLKLDIGCGPHKKEGFFGVDSIAFPGVDLQLNVVEPVYQEIPKGFEWMEQCFERKILGFKTWPWENDSVEEVHSSHFVEHLRARDERVHFLNELYRVMKVGAKATIIVPHWSSCRAYGDPTHTWSPMSEFLWYYLSRAWRQQNAPHTDSESWMNGLKCNFEVTWGYSLDQMTSMKNQEQQQFCIQHYKDVVQDMIATLTKAA